MSAELKQVAYEYETIINKISKNLEDYHKKIDSFI